MNYNNKTYKKVYLKDITFLFLVRLDSVQRLENLLLVTERITFYFDSIVLIREADYFNNKILKSLIKKGMHYEFVEDKDPVLHKTKHYNQMLQNVTTPYVAIWDVDAVPDKKAILECAEKLRSKEADVAYPYNGICYNVPDFIKSLFLKKRDIRLLHRHSNKMNRLYDDLVVGGAIILNMEKYIKAGLENENHYGWACEDYERFERFKTLGYNIYHFSTPLYHLNHPRKENSSFVNYNSRDISVKERLNSQNSSKDELLLFQNKNKNNI